MDRLKTAALAAAFAALASPASAGPAALAGDTCPAAGCGPELPDDPTPPVVGDWAVLATPGTFFFKPAINSCPTKDELHRVAELYQVDKSAGDLYVAQHCTPLPFGTDVMVEQNSLWSRMMCVRPRGLPDCVWVSTNSVENRTHFAHVSAAVQFLRT